MLSQGFADVTRGIDVDRAAFARDMQGIAPAERCYVLMFAPRSGSSWITSLLSGRLGWPHEFLNPGFVRDTAIAMDATTPADLLQMLLRRRKTANGVFGIEARFIDIHALDIAAFAAVFAERAVFFNLWRENLVAQGISLYRAAASRRFHSDATTGTAEPPPYDAAEIRFAIGQVAQVENDNIRLLRKLGVATRFLCYEELVQDRAGTIALFCRALGVAYDPAEYEAGRSGELVKLADGWNQDVERRFRADCAGEVAMLEGQRLVRRGLVGTTPFSPPGRPGRLVAWQAGCAHAQSGADPFANPHRSADPRHASWLEGWRAGWDDQIYLDADSVVAESADAPVPEARAIALAAVPHRLPAPLHDYTAFRLTELLHDQQRRAVPGALVEIGLSHGRQTAILLHAARASAVRLVGFDPAGGHLSRALGYFLRRRAALRDGEWTTARLDLDSATADQATALIQGPARFIAIDCSYLPHQVEPALALAESLIGPDGCVTVSDFRHPGAPAVTEGVTRFFAQPRGLAPFAYIPGRLLLAPSAAAPHYAELILALALRDRESAISARFIESLAQNGGAALNQTLFGSRIIVLS